MARGKAVSVKCIRGHSPAGEPIWESRPPGIEETGGVGRGAWKCSRCGEAVEFDVHYPKRLGRISSD
jgi:hypothetical protein